MSNVTKNSRRRKVIKALLRLDKHCVGSSS